MTAWIHWDPSREIFRIPYFNVPILWYGVLFAVGFFVGYLLMIWLLERRFPEKTRDEAKVYVERLSFYVIIGTIVGARLGHVFFYDAPASYMADPLSIFRTWEGGLASHGGVAGVLLATAIFYFRSRKLLPGLTFVGLLDLMVIPAAFVSGMIRIGNFCNQEILGTIAYLPWSVVFGHPADGSPPVPRHPAQLYEAAFYFALFAVLLIAWKGWSERRDGICVGWFLTLAFTFRFVIEYLKEEQSAILSDSFVTMGQLLSVPVIGLGIFFLAAKNLLSRRDQGQHIS